MLNFFRKLLRVHSPRNIFEYGHGYMDGYLTCKDDLEKEGPDVAYICDGKACAEGSCRDGLHDVILCRHTCDISHALNFEQVAPGKYMEKDAEDAYKQGQQSVINGLKGLCDFCSHCKPKFDSPECEKCKWINGAGDDDMWEFDVKMLDYDKE